MNDTVVMPRTHSTFVRVLIGLICVLFASMVAFKYFYLDPKGDISAGLLVLLAFFLVLVLSESFDNFSIGKLVSLSRLIEAKDVENKSLKSENAELRGHLITVATSVTQHQTSTNIVGIPATLAKAFSVQPAGDDEVEAKRTREEEAAPAPAPAQEAASRRIDRRKLEDLTITKFLAANSWQSYTPIREAKLTAQFAVADPVSDESPLFDGYITTPDAEVFIEVRQANIGVLMSRERLYLMLTKLSYYRTIKKSPVILCLVYVSVPGEGRRESVRQKIASYFQPAISNGLLRVAEISISEEELASINSDGGSQVTPYK